MYPYNAMASAQDQTTGEILIYDVVTPVPIQAVPAGKIVKVVGADAKVAGMVLVEFDGNRSGRMNLSELTNLAKPRATTPTEIRIVQATAPNVAEMTKEENFQHQADTSNVISAEMQAKIQQAIDASQAPEITSEIERQLKQEMAESNLAPLTPHPPQPTGGGAMLIAGLVLAGLVLMQ